MIDFFQGREGIEMRRHHHHRHKHIHAYIPFGKHNRRVTIDLWNLIVFRVSENFSLNGKDDSGIYQNRSADFIFLWSVEVTHRLVVTVARSSKMISIIKFLTEF